MNDPKSVAAGILARGKAMHEASGAKSMICSCDRLGMYRCEAHGEANRRKEGMAVIAAMGVTELCATHGGLMEYVAQLEKERDSLRSEVSQATSALERAHDRLDASAVPEVSVSDEMVQRALEIFGSADALLSPGWSPRNAMRAALVAAFGKVP